MSYYQISSGNGPVECELAVAKFLGYLTTNFDDVEIIETTSGYEPGTLRSAFLKAGPELGQFLGTILWVCPSPYRPHHRRKNWFISFSAFADTAIADFDESKVSFQTMRASGHGGQNVNKVETAVRATYMPTGYSTVAQDERSQLRNKKRALERIKLHLLRQAEGVKAEDRKDKWQQHNTLKRGEAVARFVGQDFALK